MKFKFLSVGFLIFAFSLASCSNNGSQDVPSEDESKKSIGNIVVGDVRVQILDEKTFRFEEKYDGEFEDRDTFFIPNRSKYKGAVFTQTSTSEYQIISVGDTDIYIPKQGTLDGIFVTHDEEEIYRYSNLLNTGTLPSPSETPEAFAISDSTRMFIPEGGYSYRPSDGNLSGYEFDHYAGDIYLLTPFGDAKELRQLYVNLTGKSEMVRLSALGSWDSKYYKYTEETALEEIELYKENDLPLDNLVIDTDWRVLIGAGGTGYEVDTTLFPDMKGFIDKCHDQNINLMFNDHPEPAAGSTSLLDPIDVNYRESNLKKYLEMGVDYWWYDRNWWTTVHSPFPDEIKNETLGSYLYWDITNRTFQEMAGSDGIYTRPIIMSNYDEISNGTFKQTSNTAFHRFSINWTGDINSSTSSLKNEIYNTIRAGIDSVPYVNSDIGGHIGNPSNELYTRWVQYGALSPIFRPHSGNSNDRYRQPWLYGEDALNISRDYLKMRYRLLALFYQLAFESYETGMPLVRSLEFNYPDDPDAKRYDEWLLGDNILFAPITDDTVTDFKSAWYDDVEVEYFNNTELEGSAIEKKTYSSINFNWGGNSPEYGVNADNFSARMTTKITPTEDIKAYITVDDGCRVYLDGKLVVDEWGPHDSSTILIGELNKNETHDLVIEYYEGSGNAICRLTYENIDGNNISKEVYLPEGQWMNIFDGAIYDGKQYVEVKCNLEESPIFIKMGSIVPLLDYASNTTDLDWSNITYDVYPSKNGSCSSYLYEDDHDTTAYKLGLYRKSNYSSYFDEEENCFVVNLDKGQGDYNGENNFSKRDISLKIHKVGEFKEITKVTLNGMPVSGVAIQKDNSFPFSTDGGARDGDVLNVSFNSDVYDSNVIKIYLD